MRRKHTTTIAQNPPVDWRQLEIFSQNLISWKPQIASIPGISIREKNRYRIVIGDVILDDYLSLEQALELLGGAS